VVRDQPEGVITVTAVMAYAFVIGLVIFRETSVADAVTTRFGVFE
jgi:hypothetical protein